MRTPKEIAGLLGQRTRACRLERGWSQAELAVRADVAVPTLKVFERGGQISLPRLVRLIIALGRLSDLETMLTASTPASLDDLNRPQRQRGRSSSLLLSGDSAKPQRPKSK